jgi:hypothetical protein
MSLHPLPFFPFPCSKNPVPDATIDFSELWKAVSMAKPLDTVKSASSSKGTTEYDEVLYCLGIDIETGTALTNPEDINIDGLQPEPTVQYSHLSTHEQIHELAEEYKRYSEGLNEPTLAARLMANLFVFSKVPDPDDPARSMVPCQTLEFRGAFTSFDRFNKDLYNYVRAPAPSPASVPKKKGGAQPYESELRYRSDLTIMAYNNAISQRLRRECWNYPGVHNSYKAVAPFLSVEFKSSPADKREAIHQVVISSFVSLVERQRLRRLRSNPVPYTEDADLKHYAYTVCGTEVTVWVTTLEVANIRTRSRSYTTYKTRQLRVLNLRIGVELEEFLEWHRRIVTWGLGVYVSSYVRDMENTMGAPGRESLERLIITEKEVTEPVNLGMFDEQAETEQAETETKQEGAEQVGMPLKLPLRHPTGVKSSRSIASRSSEPSSAPSLSMCSMLYSQFFHYLLCWMLSLLTA